MKSIQVIETSETMTLEQLHEDSEQEQLEHFHQKKQNCFGCCSQSKSPIAIATNRVRREGYHEDEHGNAIEDIWHEYFCDQCYKEEYIDNGCDPEELAEITERN